MGNVFGVSDQFMAASLAGQGMLEDKHPELAAGLPPKKPVRGPKDDARMEALSDRYAVVVKRANEAADAAFLKKDFELALGLYEDAAASAALNPDVPSSELLKLLAGAAAAAVKLGRFEKAKERASEGLQLLRVFGASTQTRTKLEKSLRDAQVGLGK